MNRVQFAPVVDEDLAAAASRDVSLQVGGLAALAGSVLWIGSAAARRLRCRELHAFMEVLPSPNASESLAAPQGWTAREMRKQELPWPARRAVLH